MNIIKGCWFHSKQLD